jgi:prophage regulatory protein
MSEPVHILRCAEVMRRTGKPKSSIYEDMSSGIFPLPIPIGKKAVGWIESEIAAWQKERIAQRDLRLVERTAKREKPADREAPQRQCGRRKKS